MRSLFWIVACLVICAAAQLFEVALKRGSAIYSDIKRIYHDPKSCEVIIDLKINRRCEQPSFMVRLSGVSLYLMDLKYQNETARPFATRNNSHYQFTYPPILDQGMHFIEVMVLHCKRFHPHSFHEMCLESITDGANIVTLPYSFLPPPVRPDLSSVRRPRWILSNKPDKPAWVPQLLSTRHQALTDEEVGGVMEDGSVHARYEMVDLPPLQEKLRSVLKLSHAKPLSLITVCMVGCSHARGIAAMGNQVAAQMNKNNTVRFIHLWSRFPHQFDLNAIIGTECSYAVIGYGQWFFNKDPDNRAKRYTREVSHVMKIIANYTGPVQFFVRSMNYVPLNRFNAVCPPKEYRPPPTVDMANHIMKMLSIRHHMEYIDTNFIIGPLWDSALDWCHPSDKIFTAEAHWVLHKILNSTLHHQRPVRFDIVPNVTDNDVLRFIGDPTGTVYLHRNGTVRAFPNGETFAKMGFLFEKVKAFIDFKRRYFQFGAELPNL